MKKSREGERGREASAANTAIIEIFRNMQSGGDERGAKEAMKSIERAVQKGMYFENIDGNGSIYDNLRALLHDILPEEVEEMKKEDPENAAKLVKDQKRTAKILPFLEGLPEFKAYAKEVEEEHYNEYCKDLGLSEADLVGKRILDVGAGARLFASHVIGKGIAPETFSLDLYMEEDEYAGITKALWSKELRREVEGRSLRADMVEMPFKDDVFDLLIFHGALPTAHVFHELPRDMKRALRERNEFLLMKTIQEVMRILKTGGEARIGYGNNDGFKRAVEILKESGVFEVKLGKVAEKPEWRYVIAKKKEVEK